MKAVIIDDVLKAQISLKRSVESLPLGIEILGCAESVVNGIKLIKATKPELVFLDIELQDGTGFDVLEILSPVNFKVIFTTSSNAYAIKAFRFSAIDYLLKPIDLEQLEEAVRKAKNQVKPTKPEYVNMLLQQMKTQKPAEKIALHSAEKIQIVNVTDIVRCEADVNCTTFYFASGSPLLVTKTLKYFDQLLAESGFLRVHQSHLVNGQHIKEFIKTDGGYLLMDNNQTVPVSARKKAEVIDALAQLR